MRYTCALKEMETKFNVLDTEFELQYKRNPISSISTRLKRADSIVNKLIRLGYAPTLENLEKYINYVSGIRVVCSYIDDIYRIADSLLAQDDIKLIARKDYIKNPKPNGYRSLHLIVTVPVFFAEKKREMKVEVQIRTIAMDFWASLEHQLKYKKELPEHEYVVDELRECAEIICNTDQRMLDIRRHLETIEDEPSEEDILLERLARLDVNIK